MMTSSPHFEFVHILFVSDNVQHARGCVDFGLQKMPYPGMRELVKKLKEVI
jgi:hypothetical protein